jgi:hypothetical protein
MKKFYWICSLVLSMFYSTLVVEANEKCTDTLVVLLADESESMDKKEREIQRSGYKDAFRSKAVIQRILSGECGNVWVSYVEFRTFPTLLVPWTNVYDAQSSYDLAEAIYDSSKKWSDHDDNIPWDRGSEYFTAIGRAMLFAKELLNNPPVQRSLDNPYKKVIDVSADGRNSIGISPKEAKKEIDPTRNEIRINGLPITWNPDGDSQSLVEYFWEEIVGGFGAFVFESKDQKSFSETFAKKFMEEIS